MIWPPRGWEPDALSEIHILNVLLFRNLQGESQPDEECLLCTELTKDQPDCRDTGNFPCSTLCIVGWGSFLMSLFLLCVGIGCWCHRTRRKSARKRRQHYFDVTPISSPIDASQSFGDSRSELSVVEMDPVKPSQFVETSHIDEVTQPVKVEATIPILPSIRLGVSHHTAYEHYSNMPTAPFGCNPLSYHNETTPSNLPTNLYDEAHPSQTTHNNTIMTPTPRICSPHHYRNELNNMLGCVSTDNKMVGRQHAPEPTFEPESFDTRSVAGDMTRSHKI